MKQEMERSASESARPDAAAMIVKDILNQI